MARLARTVFVRDPKKHRDIILREGEEPAPEYAALVPDPSCWVDGELPDTVKADQDNAGSASAADDGDKAASAAKKTAARKTSAAAKPAGGRDAAAEGTSGD
ncbi:hypothetical protein OV320_2679 [Actinobacteria bacterium OV320]|jgi:hypothetical protein|nr:hypothetical protein OV320_2679 [Actinobacteria bacterium OV320]